MTDLFKIAHYLYHLVHLLWLQSKGTSYKFVTRYSRNSLNDLKSITEINKEKSKPPCLWRYIHSDKRSIILVKNLFGLNLWPQGR